MFQENIRNIYVLRIYQEYICSKEILGIYMFQEYTKNIIRIYWEYICFKNILITIVDILIVRA